MHFLFLKNKNVQIDRGSEFLDLLFHSHFSEVFPEDLAGHAFWNGVHEDDAPRQLLVGRHLLGDEYLHSLCCHIVWRHR